MDFIEKEDNEVKRINIYKDKVDNKVVVKGIKVTLIIMTEIVVYKDEVKKVDIILNNIIFLKVDKEHVDVFMDNV